MAGKSKRVKIKLVSTESAYYYVTTINKANAAGTKLERNKYDPVVRKHVKFKESKIKS